MRGPSERGNGTDRPGRESYARLVASLLSVHAGLAAIGLVIWTAPADRTRPTPTTATTPSAVAPRAVAARPAAKAADSDPEPPAVDPAAVARAEAALDAAARDRERAEARAADAATRLADAATRAAAESRTAKTLAFRVRDPGTRVTQAGARASKVRAELDQLKGEVAALGRAPRPKAKVLSNKNPVARPAGDAEDHFEVRRDRVSYIDLDRLITMVKADAQLRIRMSDGARVIDSKVGPVGVFSLQYSMARTMSLAIDEVMDRRVSLDYGLRAWEVVPEFEGRGETLDAARRPFSDFARAVSRLNPARATVTFWVYPDGFKLYRQLRDDLHARGFVVAARPLLEGMAIRGSPGGSHSAGQ